MSDLMNDLVRIGRAIADGRESLEQALRLVAQLLGDVPEEKLEGDLGWPAMEVLAERLEALVKPLAELPGPEIAQAIEEAEADLDDLSDRADALSY